MQVKAVCPILHVSLTVQEKSHLGNLLHQFTGGRHDEGDGPITIPQL
jgi:hypothetical protein